QLPCPVDLIQFYVIPEEDEKTVSSCLSANERDSSKNSDTNTGNGTFDLKKNLCGRYITLGSDNKKAGYSDGLSRNSPAMISLTKSMEAVILSPKREQPFNVEFEAASHHASVNQECGNRSNSDANKRKHHLNRSKSSPTPSGHTCMTSGDLMTLFSPSKAPLDITSPKFRAPHSSSKITLANLENKVTDLFSQLADFKAEVNQRNQLEQDNLIQLQTSWGCVNELVEKNRSQIEKVGALERRVDDLERKLVDMYCGVNAVGQNLQETPQQQLSRSNAPFTPYQILNSQKAIGYGYSGNMKRLGSVGESGGLN
ncbi:hypothetical protein HK096_010574, partial [Nowakowskiella sp. JEL0078]